MLVDYNITTNKLILRPPTTNDVEELFVLMQDNDLTRFLSWEAHKIIDTTRAVVESLITAQQNDKGYHWCVCIENKIIGLVSLIDVKRTIRTWTLNRAELSYWISTTQQGNGYATEACRAIVQYGFEHIQLHKIIVAHAAENAESAKICAKLNFKQYAHEHQAFMKEGKWNDLIWYELFKKAI